MDDFRFLQKPEDDQPEQPGSETVDLGDLEKVQKGTIVIDLPDGSISINFGGLTNVPAGESSDHDANLADYVGAGVLGAIADELMRLITDDITRQEQRLQDIVKGIDLLGIKLEEPRTEPNDEGISVIRHPLLLEAVLRFQANARACVLLQSDRGNPRRDEPTKVPAGAARRPWLRRRGQPTRRRGSRDRAGRAAQEGTQVPPGRRRRARLSRARGPAAARARAMRCCCWRTPTTSPRPAPSSRPAA